MLPPPAFIYDVTEYFRMMYDLKVILKNNNCTTKTLSINVIRFDLLALIGTLLKIFDAVL